MHSLIERPHNEFSWVCSLYEVIPCTKWADIFFLYTIRHALSACTRYSFDNTNCWLCAQFSYTCAPSNWIVSFSCGKDRAIPSLNSFFTNIYPYVVHLLFVSYIYIYIVRNSISSKCQHLFHIYMQIYIKFIYTQIVRNIIEKKNL